MALLALVAGQDVEPVDGSDGTDGRWQIARRVAPDRVISRASTRTPGTRTRPCSRRQDGFKAHLAVEPDTGLITGCELTTAAGPDASEATVGAELARRRSPRLSAANRAGRRCWPTPPTAPASCSPRWPTPDTSAMIKPWPIRPAVPGGFTIDDFTVDEAAGTVDLPGRTSPARSTAAARSIFGAACRRLPAARPLHHQPHRPQPEHSATTTRCPAPTAAAPPTRTSRPSTGSTGRWSNAPSPGCTRGNRRLRYRGTTKNNTWLHHRAAALNLRRLLNLGLTRDQATWTLA